MDAELVRRGLARSREHAQELIAAGRVLISGAAATKPATAIEAGTPLRVVEVDNEVSWASRGAHKLLGALEAFGPRGLEVEAKRCLDAGASTGGFTDVLLHHGAREVVAVDVGYGQLVWRLQSDDRVHVIDRTNVRSIDAEQIGGPVDLVVADLSFISLKLVLPALAACAADGADLFPMVKPQFEVGKDRVGLRWGGARPGAACRRGTGCREDGSRRSDCVPSVQWPARCRDRRATSSTSCGSARMSHPRTGR